MITEPHTAFPPLPVVVFSLLPRENRHMLQRPTLAQENEGDHVRAHIGDEEGSLGLCVLRKREAVELLYCFGSLRRFYIHSRLPFIGIAA